MPRRQIYFPAHEFFHICNKSIERYQIFAIKENVSRFILSLDYYNSTKVKTSLSEFVKENKKFDTPDLLSHKQDSKIKVLSYCIMPDHYHLLIKPNIDDCISQFIGVVENSYTRFFNTKYKRRGPLWQSRFRAVPITSDEQLLHVSRYIHLNPKTRRLVEKPEEWQHSSYAQFINKTSKHIPFEISIQSAREYKKFVDDRIDYQRKFHTIRSLILD